MTLRLFVTFLLFFALSAYADTPTQEELQKHLGDAERSLSIQTDFPSYQAEFPSAKRSNRSFSISPTFVEFISKALTVVFVIALIIILVIIIRTLIDHKWAASRTREINKPEQKTQEDDAYKRMEKAKSEARIAAEDDNYIEAIHILLLQSLSEMRKRLSNPIADSLTSREILGRLELPERGLTAFADIVKQVEVSYFGPYIPQKDDYSACLWSYNTLTEVLRELSGLKGRRA